MKEHKWLPMERQRLQEAKDLEDYVPWKQYLITLHEENIKFLMEDNNEN